MLHVHISISLSVGFNKEAQLKNFTVHIVQGGWRLSHTVCVTPHIILWKNKDGINSVHVQVKRTYVFLSMQATIEIILHI